MKKRWISWMLVIAMVAALVPQILMKATATMWGNCGSGDDYENVHWIYDETTCTMTISGCGRMYQWDDFKLGPPWQEQMDIDDIATCIIETGVTSVGYEAFAYCDNLTTVVIADTVTFLDNGAFERSTGLTEIVLPENLTKLNYSCFRECTNLRSIFIPKSVTEIDLWAFKGCDNLENVYYSGTEEEWNTIDIGADNECLTNATIHFETGGISWESVYIDYIISDKSDKMNSDIQDDWSPVEYHLLHLNEDDIPELWIDYGFYYSGCSIVYCVDNQAYQKDLSTGTLSYLEFGNMFHHTYGHQGIYGDVIYTLKGTEVNVVSEGTRDTISMEHEWNGESVSEDVYYEKIRNFVDPSIAKTTYDGKHLVFNYDEVLNYLQSRTESEVPDKPIAPDNFSESIYRAAVILDPESVCDATSHVEYTYINDLRTTKTPGRVLQSAAIETGYDTGASVWQKFKLAMDTLDNPTTMLLYDMKQTDVYTAILLNAFQTAIESTAKDQAEDFVQGVKSFSGTVMENVKSIHNIELQDADAFKKLDDASIAKVNEVIKQQFEKEYPDFAISEEMMESCFKLADYCGDFLTYIENVLSYIQLYRMSDTMKDVLREMRKQAATDGSQHYLMQALDDCIEIIDADNGQFLAYMIREGVVIGGARGLENLVGTYWGKLMLNIKAGFPVVGCILGGAKAGMLISDYLFGTSAITGKYFEMTAVIETEAVADNALQALGERFLDSRTEFDGQAYIDAVQVRYNLLDHECVSAYDFVTLVESTTYHQFLKNMGMDTTGDAGPAILSIQNHYAQMLDGINTNWIIYLYDTSPELYNKYRGRLKNDPMRLTRCDINCPVNVYVYDSNGTLVASAEDGRISASENVSISLDGESKTVYLYDGAQYEIVCTGYDKGTMDITIQEYVEGTEIRQAEFYDIPLSEDSTYRMSTKDNPDDEETYQITDPNHNLIDADYDSNTTNDIAHQIEVLNGYVESDAGMVSNWELREQESCKISAYVPDNYAFARWEITEGDCVIADPLNPNSQVIMGNGDVALNAVIKLESPFADVPSDSFYYKPVLWALENGITTGATETTFNPNGSCLRAQVVTFLHRAANNPQPIDGSNPFADVKPSDFFYKPVLWAVEKGITNGTSATTFGSYDVCNRAAVVTFLWRAAGSPEPESTTNPFVDVKPTDFFYKPVLWAIENGITNGVDATHFGPTSPCNRAQVVTFLYRAYN